MICFVNFNKRYGEFQMSCFIKKLLSRPHYESDATTFINDLKKANPKLENEQREGRALLWDKPQAFQNFKEYNSQNLTHPDYKYYSFKK